MQSCVKYRNSKKTRLLQYISASLLFCSKKRCGDELGICLLNLISMHFLNCMEKAKLELDLNLSN